MSISNSPPPAGAPRSRPWKALAAGAALAVAVTAAAAAAAPASGAPLEPGATQHVSVVNLPHASFHQGTVGVDGGTVHYVVGGSGPALVLLHGWPETWWSWHKVMPALSQNFTVIALDLPGLGSSSVPSSGYDKATTARRVRQAVNQLGFTQVDILGHDLGALIAYDYARDYPTEVRRVAVLETPLAGFGLEQAYGLSWHFLFNASPAPIPERIMDNQDVSTFLDYIFDGATHHPEAIDRRVYYEAYSTGAHRTGGYNYYRAFAADAVDNQTYAQSRRLTMPVLAMGAQYVFGAGVGASFQAVAADVRTVVAPDSGHWIAEENPQFLTDCAKLFFGPATGTPSSPELAACAP